MPGSSATAHKLSELEQALATLAHAQTQTEATIRRTEANLDRLSTEMRAFKDEMGAFKDEMGAVTKRMDKRWGDLANKMGTLVEDIIAPGIPEIFKRAFSTNERPTSRIRAHCFHRTTRAEQEFDALAWNQDCLLINETKSELAPEDLRAFVEVLQNARDYLDEAQGRKVVGALASFYVHPSLVTAGERAGLIMIGLSEGLLAILNSPDFKPREF